MKNKKHIFLYVYRVSLQGKTNNKTQTKHKTLFTASPPKSSPKIFVKNNYSKSFIKICMLCIPPIYFLQ